jgi:hypothetical protein
MLHLLPSAISGIRTWLGVLGLDTRPYRWSVRSGDPQTGCGEFAVGYWGRDAELEIGSDKYRMQRRSGLRGTEFWLTTAHDEAVARAVQRTRGISTRDTVVTIAGDVFNLSGGRVHFVLRDSDATPAGAIHIERDTWTVRQCRADLDFGATAFSEAVQVFVFWLCIYPDLGAKDPG